MLPFPAPKENGGTFPYAVAAIILTPEPLPVSVSSLILGYLAAM